MILVNRVVDNRLKGRNTKESIRLVKVYLLGIGETTQSRAVPSEYLMKSPGFICSRSGKPHKQVRMSFDTEVM